MIQSDYLIKNIFQLIILFFVEKKNKQNSLNFKIVTNSRIQTNREIKQNKTKNILGSFKRYFCKIKNSKLKYFIKKRVYSIQLESPL